MEMESTRRPFGRSRELGVKKPRLAEEQPNPNGRAFGQRSISAAALTPPSARYRASSDRDSDDSSRGSAYQPQPQPQQFQELVNQYKTALLELTFNSKPIITNLTIIAGENLHAAKAIAGTVCSNILEVPSEQKLPSLYLLDSIVKNIGRDYIKYFAARLPEVFCKAYRQVDSSVHSSMRHLFGTWKGVFPPQALQMIEKELGFASAINGSSSGSTTSRPDSQSQSQSQRPQHSIHVNPKYLERQQHLQQSTRVKGMTNGMAVSLSNSTEDMERPDRAASCGAGHPWVDSHKMHHLQRESLIDPLREKKICTLYGDLEYDSEVPRHSSLGIGRISGRVAEQGHAKPLYGTGSTVAETISGQKNGYDMKRGLPNYSEPKSANVDLHVHTTQSTANKTGSGMSNSWKNSEEEEFMWEMHTRVPDQDAANLCNYSKKDRWTFDNSEKLDFENHLRKPPSVHEVGSRFEREASSDSLSTEQKEQATIGHHLSSPWRLQDLPSTDGLILSGTSADNKGHMEGYSTAFSELPASGSSLAKKTVRPHVGSSHITTGIGLSATASSGPTATLGQQRIQSLKAASPSGQSPMCQHPASPLLAHTMHQQLQNSSEQDYQQLESLSVPDHKLQKLQPGDLPASSLSVPSFQQSRRYPLSDPRQRDSKKSESPGQLQKLHQSAVSNFGTPPVSGGSASDHSNSGIAETLELSGSNDILAAVLNSGILSNIPTAVLPNQSFQDVRQSPSHTVVQPPLPSWPPPLQTTSSGPRGKLTSLSEPLSLENSLAFSDVSRRNEDQPPLPPALPPSSAQNSDVVNKASNPISSLLNSLVAKGLITASKSETASHLSPELPTKSEIQMQSIATPSSKPSASVPISSINIKSENQKPSIATPSSKPSSSVPILSTNIKSENQKPSIATSSSKPSSSILTSSTNIKSKNQKSSGATPGSKLSSSVPVSSTIVKSENQNPSIAVPSSRSSSSVLVPSTIPQSSTTSTEDILPKPDAKGSVTLLQTTAAEIENLIGLEFKPYVIRELHPPVISALFDDLPHKCSICGLQLRLKEQLDSHLKWHALKKQEPHGEKMVRRKWYANSGDWVSGKVLLPLEFESSDLVDECGSMIEEDGPMVPADEDQCVCILCGDLFEDYYSRERNDWMFKGAVYITSPLGDGEKGTKSEGAKGSIVHVNCMSGGHRTSN